MNAAKRKAETTAGAFERLAIRLGRARRWEFWPAWLWYQPVVVYIAAQSLAHWRLGFTVFTAVNPAIEAGGVCGEAKHRTLGPLAARAPDLVPAFCLLDGQPGPQRVARALEFIATTGGYPVVLKPDIGQRGRGVAVIRDEAALRDYLSAAPGVIIAQRHVGGAEFGVFVYRDPESAAAHIYSVTSKQFPSVCGDGRRSLRRLIADDARARLISPLLWARFAGQLDRVPPAGETVPLVEIGAHCRGALFRDASELATPALLQTVERLFRALPGYEFGRIDLRCPSAEALARGEGLQVLELNGVTAEAAHIYEPDTPLLAGYRSMIGQWRIAFAIGAHNARRGAPVLRPWPLLRLWLDDLARGKRWRLAQGADGGDGELGDGARVKAQTPEGTI